MIPSKDFFHVGVVEIMILLFLTDYKQHQLPLARIKRIMKLDGAAKVSNDDALTQVF